MDEFDKAVKAGLKGKSAEKALAAERRQMREWGMTMPPGQAVVFDSGLGQFDQIGEIEHWIANEADEGYCAKLLFVQDGQTCPTHYHKEKHETFFVVKGSVLMVLDGVETKMKEGDLLSVAQGRTHCFTGIGPALLLETSKPCRLIDNYFDNHNVNFGHAHEEQIHLIAHRSEPIHGPGRGDHIISGEHTPSEPLKETT